MTLILVRADKGGFYLAADQRLSIKGKPVQDNSSKIVIWMAYDGVVVTGYSGPSKVNKQNSSLSREFTTDFIANFIISLGPNRRVAATLWKLHNEFFKRIGRNGYGEMISTGFISKRTRHNSQTFIASYDTNSRHHSSIMKPWTRSDTKFGMIGDLPNVRTEIDHLKRAISRRGNYPADMIQEIKSRSRQTQTVGNVIQTIYSNRFGKVNIDLWRDDEWEQPRLDLAFKGLDRADIYFPWIVGRYAYSTPLVAQTFPLTFTTDTWEFTGTPQCSPTTKSGGMSLIRGR
jgi:hypothetical protein